MPLGHLVLRVAHDRGAVDIDWDLPAKSLVQQIVLRGGREILAATHHMGDPHEMVIHYVGKVIGR